MAAKVNTTFVVVLSIALLGAVGGVIFTASKLMQNSAGDLVTAGDAKFTEGNVKDAVKLYSKAVNKEKTNVAYLRKWIESLEQYIPEGQLQYEQQFGEYQSALRQLMKLEPENPENLKKFVALQYTLLRSGPYREAEWSAIAGEVDITLKGFEAKPTTETERLRRYRGLLNVRRAVESAAPDEKMLAAAKEDLVAALKADPSDAEALLTLCDLDARDADKVRRSRPEDAKALMQQVTTRIDEFIAKNPADPQALCALVQFDLSRVRSDLPPNSSEDVIADVTQKFFDRSKPRLDKALENAKAMSQPVPEQVLRQLFIVESIADPGSRLARTESLVREGLKARPTHASFLLLLADISKQRNDYNTAVEQLEKVTKLPDLPISIEGISLFNQRRSALLQQALWGVRQWQLLPAGAEKDAAFKKCQELRDRASSVANDDPRMLFVDAQIAFVKNTAEDNQVAARLLDEYNKKTGNSDIESQLLTAQVAIQRNQPGLARDALNRILRLQPNSIIALQALGDLERHFQNFDAARTAYRQVLRLQPNNDAVKSVLSNLEAMQDPSKATDPVVAELAKLNKVQEETRDQAGANERLLELLKPLPAKYGHDPRLALPLAQAYMMVQDNDNAMKVIDASLEKFPDNKALQQFKQFSSIKDPVERNLAVIDAGNQPAIEKLLAKQLLFRQAGQPEKAKEMLAEAIKQGPDDKRVLEAQFVDMLERNDHAATKPLVDRAVRDNLDGFNGDSYRARLLADEGHPAEAVTLLKGIITRGGAQPEVYRLLGRMLAMDNRVVESIDVYKEAQKLRPTDVEIALDVIRSQGAIGRMQEALDYAREFRKFGENNLQFLQVWLTLEAQIGDRERAIAQREAILRSLPNDRDNAIALIELYINTNKPQKALELISTMRQRSDGLDLASLDAAMLWAQGKQPEAKKAFEDAIAKFSSKDKPSSEPELMYARFLGQRGDVQAAVDAMNRGRLFQDKTVREVDRAVSDFGVAIGSTSLAINGAKNVIDDKDGKSADTPEHMYQKRIVEMLLAEGKANDAATELAKLPQGAQADAQTLLIGASVAEAQNDIKKAKDMLNEAVTRFPTNVQVFQRRGQMLMKDKSTIRDAIEDFTRLIELQPSNPLGLRLRAQAYELLDEKRKMDADLRSAIKLAPTDDSLVFGYMSELIANAKEEDADLLARDVLKSRSKDVNFMMRCAATFKAAQRSDIAQRWCKEAFTMDTSDPIALAYLSALLDVARPDVAESERVLAAVGDRAKNSPMYMMATAKTRFAQNKNAEAVKLASDAAKLLPIQDEAAFQGWNGALQSIIKDPNQYRQVLNNFAGQGIAPDWMGYFRASSLIEDPAKRAEGIQVLEQLNKNASTAPVRRICYNRRGELAYGTKDYEKATSIWRDGIKEFPNDLGMVNNLAYVLSKHLGKHDEALPLAKQAADAMPDQADVLDTLGYVYLNTNQAQEAGKTLEKAGQIAKTPVSAVTIGVHYIEALKKLNRVDDAKAFATRMSPLFDKSKDQFDAELRSQWQAAVDSLK